MSHIRLYIAFGDDEVQTPHPPQMRSPSPAGEGSWVVRFATVGERLGAPENKHPRRRHEYNRYFNFMPVGEGLAPPANKHLRRRHVYKPNERFHLKAPPWGSCRRMATEGVITTNKLIRHLFAKLLPPCRHGPPPSEMEALSCTLRYGRGVLPKTNTRGDVTDITDISILCR